MAGLIFISYDRADRERARQLAERFEQERYEVWWDAHLVAGQRFERRISDALDTAACVVVLWSAASIDSDWVKDEAAEGAKRNILVPVLIDPVEIPMGFRQIHTASVPGWTDRTAVEPDFTEVLLAVSELVERNTASAMAAPSSSSTTRGTEAGAPRVRQVARSASPSAGARGSQHGPVYHGTGDGGNQGTGDGGSRRPVWPWLAAVAAVLVLAGGYSLVRWRGITPATPSELAPTSRETPSAPATGGSSVTATNTSTGAVGTSYRPAREGDLPRGVGAGLFDFVWPGGDCWQLFRGDQVATGSCGAGKQVLQAGLYTLKPNLANHFLPLPIEIRDGTVTTVSMGGTLDFKWPGGDCWQVFRGEQVAAGSCGAGKQVLQAGLYTLKPNLANHFLPLPIEIRDGTVTTVSMGGTLDFKWPGGDCWQVFRGEQVAAGSCGPGTQALQAGAYILKPNLAAHFVPMEVEIKDGATITIAIGGTLDFRWPGGDCWQVFRGEQRAAGTCGAAKQALSAGTYTIKPQFGAPFTPMTIRIRDGETITAP